MTDPATDAHTFEGPDREQITGLPRWVKVSGIVVLVLVVLFAIMRLTGVGAGNHDPGGGMDHGLGEGTPVVSQEQTIDVPLSRVSVGGAQWR